MDKVGFLKIFFVITLNQLHLFYQHFSKLHFTNAVPVQKIVHIPDFLSL